ncbi:MAG: Ig-like domain-containing protein [Bacilli bacterium]|nr:Ig-like domain-containing protein [Bacilli bacterium]
MKKSVSIVVASVITALSITSITAVVFSSKNNSIETQGYTPRTSDTLPTTLYLDDVDEPDIRSYYSALNNKGNSQKTGTNLLASLKPILKNNQIYYKYSSDMSIWQLYEIADRDWSKSPASAITYGTYDSVNNVITSYQYGNNDDGKNNPYLHALYTNRKSDDGTKAWGDHTQTGTYGINREHIWPKSHGFDTEPDSGDNGGARGDPMHLWPGNGKANNIHSNYFYGYVDKNQSYTDLGSKYWPSISGNYLGQSKTLGSGTVFEPQDQDKGDIARAVFYMVARYNCYGGNDSDGINGNNPALVLSNDLSENSRTGTSASYTDTYSLGILQDLLEWNRLDKPDAWEIHRNNLLYRNFTNNRNPFIDFPEWADYIWGDKAGSNYVNPQKDTLNDWRSDVVGTITLNKNKIALKTGSSETLTATVSDGSTVTWSSSNTTVASVNQSGKVTANSKGSATITASATIDDTTITATCAVTVTDPDATVSSVSVSPSSTSLDVYNNKTVTLSATVNGSYNPPQSVTWSTSNNTLATVDTDGVVTALKEGNVTITATSVYDSTKSGSATISISDSTPKLTSIIVQNPKTTYNAGDSFVKPTVIATYDGSTSHAVDGATFSGYSMVTSGEQTVNVSYTENGITETTSYQITVNAADSYSDVITSSITNPEKSGYNKWSDVSVTSPAKYAGVTAKHTSGAIQISSTSTGAGYPIIYTTESGGYLSTVTIAWNSSTGERTLNVYASNTAYTTSGDYSVVENRGTLIGSVSNPYSTSDDLTVIFHNNYRYLLLASNYGAMYIDSITVNWSSSELPDVPVEDFSINPHSLTLVEGKSQQIAASFTPSYATNQAIDWSSSNTSVATVSDGVVTAVSAGIATISAVTDDGGFGDSLTVTVLSSGGTFPYIIGQPYKMYVSNTLRAEECYFNGSMSGSYYGATSTDYSNAVDVYFEVNGGGYNIYFNDPNDSNSKKYIDVAINGDYKNFSINSASAPTYTWSYDSTNGYLYTSIDDKDWRLGGYSKYTTLAVYDATRTNIYDIQFKETIEVFSYYMMNKITCDASGVEAPGFNNGYSWNNLGEIYASLDASEKQEFVSASPIENSINIVEQAAYRYDYIIEKYGLTSYANFAARNVNPRIKTTSLLLDSSSTVAIIVIISLVGVTSIGAYFSLRKRKEN